MAVGPSGRLWSRSDVVVLRSARAGRRGLIPAAAGRSVLLGGPAVHGFGMSETLAVTGVDGAGRILETRQLRPRRLVWVRGARWLIEQPIADAPPPAGALLSVRVPGHAGDRPFLT